ncbi:MAG: 3-deoxy-8-phosphooctulonate synthase [Planctomycetia bacterium]|nr:3-deoxy-8-phosphooctulonate synthase [Planctomycetia bacterium]
MTAAPVAPCRVGPHLVGDGQPLLWIAGPCVIESREHALRHATALKAIAAEAGVALCYKSSYDKANRSSGRSFRGPGVEKGLEILAEVRREVGVPVLTDFHEPHEARAAAEVVDVLQVPAFLCRQTDMLLAAAATGRAVAVKKGQFLAPWDMKNVVEKLHEGGCRDILLTERGVSFGYGALVVDFRSLPVMRSLGHPVCFDATHAVQRPGGLGDRSGGDRREVPALARAAAAVGIDALFTEVHEDPDRAPSDGPNMLTLASTPAFLASIVAIRAAARQP